MGKIRQTKHSGNQSWSRKVCHSTSDHLDAANAIELTFNVASGFYNLVADQRTWAVFTTSDAVDTGDVLFILGGTGLSMTSTQVSDFTFYEADATTLVNMTGADVFNGVGYVFDEYNGVQSSNISSMSKNTTYYISFLPPLTGSFQLYAEWD